MSNTFRFFVRNVVCQGSGVDMDLVHVADGAIGKQTPFVRHPESAVKRLADELAKVAHFAKWGGAESAAYIAALKAFMVMGFNSALEFEVDDQLNVTAKPA